MKDAFGPADAIRCSERTDVESSNARLKDAFCNGKVVRVRGTNQVMGHLLFDVLALSPDQLSDRDDDLSPASHFHCALHHEAGPLWAEVWITRHSVSQTNAAGTAHDKNRIYRAMAAERKIEFFAAAA